MALASNELVVVAEITYETYERVEELVVSLNAAQEEALRDDLDTWEAIRNSFVKFKGDGVDFDNERKREAIRERIRKMLGLPLLSPEIGGAIGSVFVGGISVSDMSSRKSNTDRPASYFTTVLHKS